MSRIAYVDGRYLPFAQAKVPIEDRALQFADGIYEVCMVLGGHIIDWDLHCARLARSLAALRIAPPVGAVALSVIANECVRRNRVVEGSIYLQVTRGESRRDHPFPADAKSRLIVTARAKGLPHAAREQGVSVVTMPDLRWRRCDIKSTALLPNVLAKQEARERSAFEAWMHLDETITEGSTTNAWIILRDGTVVTHPLTERVLAGVTRHVVADLVRRAGLPLNERPFTRDEVFGAAEAFLTSTSSTVAPVVRVDDRPIGSGRPGPVVRRLQGLYDEHLKRQS